MSELIFLCYNYERTFFQKHLQGTNANYHYQKSKMRSSLNNDETVLYQDSLF